MEGTPGLLDGATGGAMHAAVDPQPLVNKAFETIGTAKVATSATEAVQLGYLRKTDKIVANQHHLWHEAKQAVLEMDAAGYRPPAAAPHSRCWARRPRRAGAGRAAAGTGRAGRRSTTCTSPGSWRYVLTGGDVPAGTRVTEQYLLDLERQAVPEPGGPSEDAGPHAAHSQDGQAAAELRSVTTMRDAVNRCRCRDTHRKSRTRGALKDVRPDDMAALVIKEAIARAPGVTPEMIDDVILGLRHARRRAGAEHRPHRRGAGGAAHVGAGLDRQPVLLLGAAGRSPWRRERIMVGDGRRHRRRRRREHEPGADGRASSLRPTRNWWHASRKCTWAWASRPSGWREQYNVSREEQDAFALESHRRAAAAIDAGKFKDEIVPVTVERTQLRRRAGRHARRSRSTPTKASRRDTSHGGAGRACSRPSRKAAP